MIEQMVPSVTVITPVFNGGSHYPNCFQSILAQDYPPAHLQIIVVNDGSTDGTTEYLKGLILPDNVLIHHIGQNSGLGAARNKGLALADGEIIILLDGDMEVSSNWVQTHVDEQAKPGRMAVMGAIAPAHWVPLTRLNSYLYLYPKRGARQFGIDRPIPFLYLLSSNTSFKKAAVDAGGRFEAFSHYGGEEVIFAFKVARSFPNGIFFSEDAVAIHHEDKPLEKYLKGLADYGYHNLPQIMGQHPEIATPLAADYAWPLPGDYFRRKRLIGLWLFNTFTIHLARVLLVLSPKIVGGPLIRFLIVATVVRNLRRYLRSIKHHQSKPNQEQT